MAPTALAREGNNLLLATEETTQIESPRMRQGFVEQSNVNPVMEISRLIEVQRAYELGQQLMKDEDERISKTVEAMRKR